jgi:hypothetical protein
MRIITSVPIALGLANAASHPSTVGAGVKSGVWLFRFEGDGFLDLYPAQISISGSEIDAGLGGAYRCVELTPGNHVAEVRSGKPVQ